MKKQIITALAIFLFPAFCIISCTKSSADQQGPGGGSTCDTVNMKYTADILPILQSNCYGCHGNGNTGGSGGISLDGYANLSIYAQNGKLRGTVTHASGFVGMPFQQAKMDDCTINKILDWINRGFLNN